MESKTRQHALFVIGSDNLPYHKLLEVLSGINHRYGGSTLTEGIGSWSEVGDKFTTTYSDINFEKAYQITISTTVEDFDLDYLKACFQPAKGYATWIHCEVWQTQAEHFKL